MHTPTLHPHLSPRDGADRLALALTRLSRWFADRLFGPRYAHRAVVLETVAAVPGMVGATLQHLHALRHLDRDAGRVRLLTEEAENEHMHLITFLEVARPTRFERLMILAAQGIFFNLYFLLYLLSPRTAHRMVGYFEEEAVVSYTRFLEAIDQGRIEDSPAPQIAIDYWRLAPNARLRDVVLAVRRDEMGHRDANHQLADQLGGRPAALAAGA